MRTAAPPAYLTAFILSGVMIFSLQAAFDGALALFTGSGGMAITWGSECAELAGSDMYSWIAPCSGLAGGDVYGSISPCSGLAGGDRYDWISECPGVVVTLDSEC